MGSRQPPSHIEFDGIGDMGSEGIHISDVGKSTYIDAINLDDTNDTAHSAYRREQANNPENRQPYGDL